MGQLTRITAFSDDPAGGNPAGVWVGDSRPEPDEMLRIAAEVGYSETAFVSPSIGPWRTVQYFSPLAEVPFCGHATIGLAHVLAAEEGEGTYLLETRAGSVPVEVTREDGRMVATLTSVEPSHVDADPTLVETVLAHLGWTADELDPAFPPAVAYAGAHHLVLAAATRERLAEVSYDFDALGDTMRAADLTTVALVWRESDTVWHARNPFPVGGVVEDPATGAAAAALGGLLRDRGHLEAPADLVVRQGEDMGRPSLLMVHVPEEGGIRVGGTAVLLP